MPFVSDSVNVKLAPERFLMVILKPEIGTENVESVSEYGISVKTFILTVWFGAKYASTIGLSPGFTTLFTSMQDVKLNAKESIINIFFILILSLA